MLALADLPAVGALFRAHSGRPADLELIGRWLDEAPGVAADEAGEMMGFAFCRRFAPDVAELANLLVASGNRGRGVGAALLAAIDEAAAAQGYRALVVVQSWLYRTSAGAAEGSADGHDGDHRSGLYARHGYREVLSTGPTVVSVKTLDGG